MRNNFIFAIIFAFCTLLASGRVLAQTTTTSPIISITSPSDDQVIDVGLPPGTVPTGIHPTITVTGTISDASTYILSEGFTIDGNPIAIGNYFSFSGGPYGEIVIDGFIQLFADNKPHTLTVTARSADGGTATKSVTFTVTDSTPPSLDIVRPGDGSWSSDNPIFEYSGADYDSRIVSDSWLIDGQTKATWLNTAYGSQFTLDRQIGVTENLAAGSHTFQATIKNGVGLSTTKTITFNIDRTPPIVNVISPMQNQAFGPNSTIPISYTMQDPESGVQSGSATIDGFVIPGSKFTYSSPPTTLLAFNFTKSAADFTEGNHLLNVIATNRVGDTTFAFPQVSFIVDKSPPQINGPFIGPSIRINGNVTVTSDIVFISADVIDNLSGVKYAEVFIDNVDEGPMNVNSSGFATLSNINTSQLTGSKHTLTIKASDNVGNTSSASKDFYIQCKIKSIAFSPKNSSSPPLDANHNPGSGIRIFPESQNPADLNDVSNNDRDVVTIKTSINMAGSHTIYIYAFDVDDPTSHTALNYNTNLDHNGKPLGIYQNNKGGTNLYINTIVTVNEVEITNAGAFLNGQLVYNNNPNLIKVDTDPTTGKVPDVDFEVTRQPGDNFRIVAVCDDTSQLSTLGIQRGGAGVYVTSGSQTFAVMKDDQSDIDPATNKGNSDGAPMVQSTLLTVWRTLHLEVDSMALVPDGTNPADINNPQKDFVDGSVIAIGGSLTTGQIPTQITVGTSLDSQSLDDGSPLYPAGNGRFENGKIQLGSASSTNEAMAVNYNDDDSVYNTSGFLIFFKIDKNNLPEISGNIRTYLGDLFELNIVKGVLTDEYKGATITVDGLEDMVISDIRFPDTILVSKIPAISFKLVDDDDQKLTPYDVSVGGKFYKEDLPILENKYALAYIYANLDGGGTITNNTQAVKFYLNINTDDDYNGALDNNFQSQGNRADDYWIGYILMAYQGPASPERDRGNTFTTTEDKPHNGSADNDPDSEPSDYGITVGKSTSFKFVEQERDINAQSNRNGIPSDLTTSAHEISHQLGTFDHKTDGMGNPILDSNGNFIPQRDKFTEDGHDYYNILGDQAWRPDSRFRPEERNIIRAFPQSPGARPIH